MDFLETRLIRFMDGRLLFLAGLTCPDLWETTAIRLKAEGRTVRLLDPEKTVYYDWNAIETERQVLTSVDAGPVEVPWMMARSMGLGKKPFCLKLGKTTYLLRHAALNLKLSGKFCAYGDPKQRLFAAVKTDVANRLHKRQLSVAKKS